MRDRQACCQRQCPSQVRSRRARTELLVRSWRGRGVCITHTTSHGGGMEEEKEDRHGCLALVLACLPACCLLACPLARTLHAWTRNGDLVQPRELESLDSTTGPGVLVVRCCAAPTGRYLSGKLPRSGQRVQDGQCGRAAITYIHCEMRAHPLVQFFVSFASFSLTHTNLKPHSLFFSLPSPRH